MARLAVAAVLLTLLVVALCHVIHREEAAVLPDANATAYNAGESVAVPAYLYGGAAADEAAVQTYDVLPSAATRPQGAVSPVDDADQGFPTLPLPLRQPPDRDMRWTRGHGLLRQHVYGGFHRHGEGFHAQYQEKQLAEVPVDGVQLGYGGETREWVALPVAEPDPDSRPDAAAVALEEVRTPAFHGEEEDEDEMARARAWRRFRHGRRFHHRHHHHHDDHEEDDHEQAEESSPVKRFRFHDDDDDEESETRSKRFHHHRRRDVDDDSDDEDELEEMAMRWVRKMLMRSRRIHHHGRRFHHHHHHLRLRHHAEDAAAGEEEEKGGVMNWLKDFVNRF